MYRAGIVGTGSSLPEKVVTNHDLAGMVETSDEWIVTRTGIHERRIAASHETLSDFTVPAALRALEAAQTDPSDLDEGDRLMPATRALLIAAILASPPALAAPPRDSVGHARSPNALPLTHSGKEKMLCPRRNPWPPRAP